MTMARAQFLLIAVFLASLTLQLAAFFLVQDAMWPDDFLALVVRLLTIYSVPLAIVLGGVFARPRPRLAAAPRNLTWISLALAVIWNVLLIARSVKFALVEQDSATAAMNYLDTVASGSSFLIAGVLTTFFVTPPSR